MGILTILDSARHKGWREVVRFIVTIVKRLVLRVKR
jgi:hypothetical protein